ncbi:hypothetical protein DID88_002213 [Monilinia fructigena]|uniref:O-methyltransferase domain-containing protein n=1 Tax=Monilinia fructigena TaxID=38457 RepID=A0A395IVN5_9HELO|nr:hypothetical protein DID88_002213 [Monilinia fructigena]
MTLKGIAAGHRMLFETIMAAAIKAPRYFIEAGHKCPTNPHDGLMQYAHHTKLQSFDYFCTMPNNVIGDFNTFMEIRWERENIGSIGFPVTERDQQHVLDEIEELHPTIERVGYNFFTLQPIKNARVYFYHHILHDWSDYKCLEILQT